MALRNDEFQPLFRRPMRRVRTVHMVGIGGVGMAGIAQVLLNLGYTVTGSDMAAGASVQALVQQGAQVSIGHAAEHIAGADVVVLSTAIASDNPEVVAAREQLLPVVPRAQMLAELMRFRYGIAVAGTHGKTTTTSLTAALLAEGELDPTFVVGGRVLGVDSNARLGAGPYLVAEADESDASFLLLTPMIAIVTNIDADHLGAYDNDFARLVEAFLEFLHHLPFYGLAVLCMDDPVVKDMLPSVARPILTYGTDPAADVRAVDIRPQGHGTSFTLQAPGLDKPVPMHLKLPGTHNVRNALAAVAVALELDVPVAALQQGLAQFAGIGRRCEVLGEVELGGKRCLLVDDYGHHPQEISATLDAVRAGWPERRLVVVFQPHRYSRTQDLFDDFCRVLADLETLVLCEVYAAGEQAIAGADGRSLARGVRARGRVEPVFVAELEELAQVLAAVIETGDVVLTLGAGNIGTAVRHLLLQPGGEQ